MIAAYRSNNSNIAGKASSTGTAKQQDQQSGQQDKQHKHKEHTKNQPILPEVGQYVIDQKNGKKYLRGRLMGKVSNHRHYRYLIRHL